ncbi:helix-turn-helix domain-containing protein [Streptomyces sp. NPDC012623]|uniref:helix-turn-helix domain-containing protein n=1 Tax=unclassified Streptomyces TaxID=2593676 RepID=UPI0036B54D69
MNRGELGAALRALRKASEKEAKSVARSAVMSTSKLSKIENGHAPPSVNDVERILTAIGVSEEVKAEYLDVARAAATEVTAWRLVRQIGIHKVQQQTGALEAQMTSLKIFQPALIPGLLQTPEYIRAVLSRHELGEDILARTIGARLERQRVIHDSTKILHFIITENVLRWRIVTSSRMAEQIDRLTSLSRLSHVNIQIIPFTVEQTDLASHSFIILDGRTVTVETIHAEVNATDPRDVALYVKKFNGFASVALSGDNARAMMESIRSEYLREQETG